MTRAPAQWLRAADESLQRAGAARVAWLAVLAGFAARAALLAFHPGAPDGDERTYMALAENLAHHGIFSVDPRGPLEVHYAPLYPFLQAALVLLGISSLHAGWTISLLAGSLCVGLVYRLALPAWRRPVAAAAAAGATIIHPDLLDASRLVYNETLCSLLLLVAVLALGGRRPGASAGIALGLAALTRRESALLVPAFAALLWWDPPSGSLSRSRGRLREVGALLLSFFLLFAPYLMYLRVSTGRWTMSGRTNYSWIIGRLMQERPGEGLSASEISRLDARYPTPVHWYLASPWRTTRELAEAALFHLRVAFFGSRAWPMGWLIGLMAVLGLAQGLALGRLRVLPPSRFLVPFLLILPWACAGPFLRYSRGIVPFVCLLVGGLLCRRLSDLEGLKTPP